MVKISGTKLRREKRTLARKLIREAFKEDKVNWVSCVFGDPIFPDMLVNDHLGVDMIRFPFVNYKRDLRVNFEGYPVIEVYNPAFSSQAKVIQELYLEKRKKAEIRYFFNNFD
ncbi:MAG: hypothetical protein WC812_00400 [Candidatus Pacearchaeota archaeon]|jgi:hypothetical protein